MYGVVEYAPKPLMLYLCLRVLKRRFPVLLARWCLEWSRKLVSGRVYWRYGLVRFNASYLSLQQWVVLLHRVKCIRKSQGNARTNSKKCRWWRNARVQFLLWLQFSLDESLCPLLQTWVPLEIIIVVWQRVNYGRELFEGSVGHFGGGRS